MPGFEPLLDDAGPLRRSRDDSDSHGDFLRNSAPLTADEAASTRTQDRGGGAIDYDLGRSLYSTPRLESVAKNSWSKTEPERHWVDEMEGAAPQPRRRNAEYISNIASNASTAIMSGREAGNDAAAYRSKFADIRRQRWGGVLNYNNWGWVKRMRENKLRSKIAAAYGQPSRVTSPAAQVPEAVPQGVPQVSDAQVAEPSIPDHRTAVPGRSILKAGPSRIHDATTIVPALATAQAEQATAFATEETAAAPFESTGALQGRLDVRMAGGAKSAPKIFGAGQSLMGAAGLFGAIPTAATMPTQAETDQTKDYAAAMQKSYDSERLVRARTSQQHLQDQGAEGMVQPQARFRPFRAAFFNGYWNSEMAQPHPTRQAQTANRVRFDASADQVPEDQRDPDREYARQDRQKRVREAPRKAAFQAKRQEFREANAQMWSSMMGLGAQVHGEESQPPVPAPGQEAPLIEEES